MAGYFSFRKLITGYFVKTIYALGLMLLTAAGLAAFIWAGMRLNNGELATRPAIYYLAGGAGVLIIGNLIWRMVCELWLLLFGVHSLLVSIDRAVRHETAGADPLVENQSQVERAERPRRTMTPATSRAGVLGLS
jgi:hypothetical protein